MKDGSEQSVRENENMKREREPMKCSITIISAAMLLIIPAAAHGKEVSRPNVLMIIADDLNDWIGCLDGHPDARTPNIDRLARRGLLFENAHCAAPVCNPSRVATMTGRRPSSTGIYDNKPVWHEVMPGVTSIPQHFQANGYYTAGGGKVYHHPPGFNRKSDWNEYFDQAFDGHYQAGQAAGDDMSDFAWPEGYPLNGIPEVKSLGRPPRNAKEFDWGPLDKSDDETGDGRMIRWAEDFLADPPDEPFFLAAGIYRPHLPFYAPHKYFDMYPPNDITPPLIKEDDIDDLPEAGLLMAEQRREDLELVRQHGQYKHILQAYLASVTFCDAMVGRLLDALDSSPAAENTIIVFWSDNGWHFGEKEHLHKMTLWARSTRLPLIIAAPGVTQPETSTSRPVSFVDLFPTLNELCDLPQSENLDGTSLVPLLIDPNRSWEQPALVTYLQGNHAVCDEQWRYIRYADGGEELYDHENDPNEWTNLAERPDFDDVIAELSVWLPEVDAPSLRKTPKRLINDDAK
jgi:arylsulfatase A-like enzyme